MTNEESIQKTQRCEFIIKSFIAYFYENNVLTEDGVDLSDIVYDIPTDLSEYHARIKTYDPQNEIFDKIKDKTLRVEIEFKDANHKLIYDKYKIRIINETLCIDWFEQKTKGIFEKI